MQNKLQTVLFQHATVVKTHSSLQSLVILTSQEVLCSATIPWQITTVKLRTESNYTILATNFTTRYCINRGTVQIPT